MYFMAVIERKFEMAKRINIDKEGKVVFVNLVIILGSWLGWSLGKALKILLRK